MIIIINYFQSSSFSPMLKKACTWADGDTRLNKTFGL